MYHYIALAWPSEDLRAADAAQRIFGMLSQAHSRNWTTLMAADGLSVYSDASLRQPMPAYVLPGDRGVILGRVFTSNSAYQTACVPVTASAAIVETSGRWLVNNCWGRYVGVFRLEGGHQSFVVRDCSGAIPCFYLCFDGVHIFFADVRDIEGLCPRLTVNERYLAAFICRQPLHVRETGLNEVIELLAGDRVSISARGITHDSIWNPREVISTRITDDYPELRARLVEVTKGVVRTWAELSTRILLNLSGGLDSAIVLGCLKHLGYAERVVCVTHYSPGTASDERPYARSAAQLAGARLIEAPLVCDGIAFAENLCRLPPDPRPDISKTVRLLTVGTLNEIAEEFGCDTLWTGQGGDQIFLQRTHAYSAADYLLLHRMPWRLPARAYEAAILSRQSVWNVLLHALLYRFVSTASTPIVVGGRGTRFLATSASLPMDSALDPWRVGDEVIPPGKLDQLDVLHDLLNRHKPLLGLECPYEQHPLISQPLLELSLRIPTYHLLNGGRQRALARDAFRDHVPASIIWREDKGSTTDQLRSLLRGSAPVVQESLLEGTLVSLGILDRSSLEGILMREETYAKDDVLPIFACIAAESWLRHWKTGVREPAGA